MIPAGLGEAASASPSEPTEVLIFSPKGVDEYEKALRSANLGLHIHSATDRAGAERHLPNVEILLSANSFPVELLERAERLRWIHVQGAGVNNWTSRGIPPRVQLSRTTGTFGPRMAQYVLTYIGAVAQSVPELLKAQEQQRWSDPPIIDLSRCRLGVAGLGSIGSSIAKLAQAFGMSVSGLSRSRPEGLELDAWYPTSDLHDFLRSLDFLAIVLPLTPDTRGMFDARALASLPAHAWLVNVGRGPLIVEADLLTALNQRSLGGAVLDVFEQEPLPAGHPLWDHPNVIVTPHCSGGTITSEVVDVFIRNLQRWRAGAALENEVDLTRAY